MSVNEWICDQKRGKTPPGRVWQQRPRTRWKLGRQSWFWGRCAVFSRWRKVGILRRILRRIFFTYFFRRKTT